MFKSKLYHPRLRSKTSKAFYIRYLSPGFREQQIEIGVESLPPFAIYRGVKLEKSPC